ncbi:hypothetical protein O6H91_10G002100 [Diphasiastrum complanatum]|uniref:Uncharacterized protein n=1 Tax=Diphasiastrum complanatum TaxID=34168 RepID=A0ACC2CDM1_DIPCM|nr:hypothetical protein O6H91_Y403600 [Diphasiastrum complanatum]KAJ7295360.1 hypothetical protein O6H91_Y194500 [Diphasiastrum complanatum]KAJ7540133.1 hypothetical protein O6H91_10G002100 [Diphasiastrum complanatum]
MDISVKMQLEEKLWSWLPSEVLEDTLAFLPFSAFSRFRSVCKRWNSLLSCPAFLELRKRIPLQTEPCILFQDGAKPNSHTYLNAVHDYTLMLYNTSIGVFRNVDLQFLEEHLDNRREEVINNICNTDGGLLLIASLYVDHPKRFSVCNPLLKCWRQLPILPATPPTYCHLQRLVVDKLTKTYKVIAVRGQFRDNMGYVATTHVYESISNRWNESGSVKLQLMESMHGRTIVCGKVMYAMTDLRHNTIMAYNIEDGIWSEISIHQLRKPSYSIWTTQIKMELKWNRIITVQVQRVLVGTKGRLFTVLSGYTISDIAIWELKIDSTAEWKELVATIPHRLIVDVFSDINFDVNDREVDWRWWATGFEDYIVLRWYDRNFKTSRTIVYDLLQGSWQRSPHTIWPAGMANYALVQNVGSLSLDMQP